MPIRPVLKEKSKYCTTTTISEAGFSFQNSYGKFYGERGAAILEIYLLRREVALAQLDLMRKRRKLAWREVSSLKEILEKRGKRAA